MPLTSLTAVVIYIKKKEKKKRKEISGTVVRAIFFIYKYLRQPGKSTKQSYIKVYSMNP